MARKVKAQPVTLMQKFFMSIVGIIVLVSFLMMCLDALGFIQTDLPFTHIVISMLSAMGGYLFGNNTKISIPV